MTSNQTWENRTWSGVYNLVDEEYLRNRYTASFVFLTKPKKGVSTHLIKLPVQVESPQLALVCTAANTNKLFQKYFKLFGFYSKMVDPGEDKGPKIAKNSQF